MPTIAHDRNRNSERAKRVDMYREQRQRSKQAKLDKENARLHARLKGTQPVLRREVAKVRARGVIGREYQGVGGCGAVKVKA